MTIATTTVLSAKTVEAFGRSIPTAVSSALSPFARPSPPKRPISDASAPIARLSSSTERSTCCRDAPSVRSVANSRARCATVIEIVLKMTKAPTKSAIPANVSRMIRKILTPWEVSFEAERAAASAVFASTVGGSRGVISATSSAFETPGFPATEMPSS